MNYISLTVRNWQITNLFSVLDCFHFLNTLSADVGGMLGLFLGASVFTILNLFWLLIQKCVIYIRGGELAGEVQEEINPAECLPNIVETPR